MNEGHSAFLGLERARHYVQDQGLSFAEALEVVRASTVFTTHTPVPAGHDVFNWDMMDRFFSHYWPQLGLERQPFLELARHDQVWGPGFSMTVLALHMAGRTNGVAALHGIVSRDMWQWLWPGTPVDEIPIGHVTNGVHLETWLGPEMAALLDAHLPAGWRDRLDEPGVLDGIYAIPAADFWHTHMAAKRRLIDFVRRRARARALRQGESPAVLAQIEHVFDVDAFTIGFARRFATYKRANLIFQDMERFNRLLHSPQGPTQIMFSGKAHPADDAGKAYIQHIVRVAQTPEYWDKVGFIENYDMNVGRYLVQGVDLWLNNPRRPREASGTSGEKAAMNGVPNLSVLDGWWVEGYNGKNGWVIGEEREYRDYEVQDEADALSLYRALEHDIVPLFFDRDDEGVPQGWVAVAKEAMHSSLWAFSFRRMLEEYCQQLYSPAAHGSARAAADQFAAARDLAAWKAKVRQSWPQVNAAAQGPDESQLTIGEAATVSAQVHLGVLRPEDVLVEIVYGGDDGGGLTEPVATAMALVETQANGVLLYRGDFEPNHTGALVYGVRVLPHHPAMLNKHELGLVCWAY
jgi:starch phosphorylase